MSDRERSDTRASQSGAVSPANVALGVLVVAVAVAALVFAFSSPATETASSDSVAATPVPAATAATAAPALPPKSTDAHAASAADVALAFTDQIDTDNVHFGVAYPVADGVMVLNRSGANVPAQAVAQNLGIVTTLPLLTTGEATWAIDPRGDGRTYLVTNSFTVVKSTRLNTLAVYDPASGEVELLAAGQPAPGVELPAGAQVLDVQRRGLLVLPRTGGTYEIDGLADSLRRIDDGRAVAGSQQATIFERCDEELQCHLVLRVGEDGDEQAVPLQPGSPISLSPSGAWALQYDGSQNTIVATTNNDTFELAPGEIRAAAWASTGDFVALLRADSIELFYPHDQRSLAIELVVPPETNAMTVYSSAVDG